MCEDLISIIVPVYKVENYLEKCVDSIINQTYQNIEIILVDDGSPDGCPKMCDEYSANDNRIRVIHKANGGLSDARNAGLDASTGKYIMFVDSDDYIETDMVETLYNALKKNDADMSICNARYFSETPNRKFDNDNLPIKDETISGEEILKEKLFQAKFWYWVFAVCKLYKACIFTDLRFMQGKLHEDQFILHKILLQCNKVACVSKMLYNYLQRDNSIMGSKKNIRRLDDVEALIRRAIDYDNLPGYEALIFPTLVQAGGCFCHYYCNFDFAPDSSHRKRNRELQKMYRLAVNKSGCSYRKASLINCLKVFLCYFNLYPIVVNIYRLFVKRS